MVARIAERYFSTYFSAHNYDLGIRQPKICIAYMQVRPVRFLKLDIPSSVDLEILSW